MRFCASEVAGASNTAGDFPVPELEEKVRQMLHEQKMGCVQQVEIDSLIMPYLLAMNRDPILRTVDWRDLVSREAHTFQACHLPDIGREVRCMILRSFDGESQLLHLMRYSMPYIKHNRLSFFPFKSVRVGTLRDVLRLQLATCLGLHSECSKKPTWRLRVQLIAMFTKLLAVGTPMDMHIFCCAHVPLLRISLIECYVHFVERNMPVEAKMQHNLFGIDANPSVIFRQIKNVADLFRQTQFQGTHLDWDSVNAKAQAAVERCNRCCKGVAVEQGRLESPQCADAATHVQCNALPFNVAFLQCQQLQRRLARDTVACVNSCFFYACTRCSRNVPDKRLRTAENNTVVCAGCQSSEFITKINIIGKIVCIARRKFYLCPFCMVVHEWKSSGFELTCCSLSAQPQKPSRQCVICGYSNSSLTTVAVLDSHIGVMQYVRLCGRHTPYEHQMKFVHDLGSLVFRIQNKFKKKS